MTGPAPASATWRAREVIAAAYGVATGPTIGAYSRPTSVSVIVSRRRMRRLLVALEALLAPGEFHLEVQTRRQALERAERGRSS